MFKYDLLLAANALVFALVVFIYARNRAASMFHPVTFYLSFHGLVFVFRPIIVRIYDLDFLYRVAAFTPSIDDKITAILAANLCMITFMIVSLRVANIPWSVRPEWRSEGIRHALRTPYWIVAAIFGPIALYSLLTSWWNKATATSTMISDSVSGIVINTDTNGWFFAAQLMMVPLTVILAWLYRFKWWSLVPFLGFFFLKAGTGGRGAFIVASAMLVMLYLVDKRRNWPEWRSVALIALAAFAFSFVVVDRGQSLRKIFVEDQSGVKQAEERRNYFDHPDFGNMEMLEYVIYVVPGRSGTYEYFSSNLQIFTEPIPRVWWKDKPAGAPVRFFNLLDYGRPYGFTFTVAGIGWMAFGYVGVIVQAIVFALIYSFLYRGLFRPKGSTLYLLFYTVMIAATIVTFRDGTLVDMLRVLPFYGAPVLFMALLFRFIVGRQSPAMAARNRAAASLPIPTPVQRRQELAARFRARNS